MDRGVFLPFKKNVGVQLGPGIRNSALYVPVTEKSQQAESKWILGTADKEAAGGENLWLAVNEKRKFLDIENDVKTKFGEINDDELIQSTSDSEQESIGSLVDSSSSLRLFRSVRMLSDYAYEVRVDSPVAPLTFCPHQVLDVPEGLNTSNTLQAVEDEQSSERKLATARDGILSGLKFRSRIIDPSDVADFTIGFIHTTNDLRINNDAHQVIAYASGETRSIIYFSMVKSDNTTALPLSIGSASSYNLHSKIKNIVIPDFSSILNRASDIIAVLTANSLYAFKIRSIEKSTGAMSIEKLGPYPFSILEDFAFTDVAFNPWDFNELAVIDIKGNWAVGNLVKKGSRNSRLRFSANKRGTIYDPEELSSWHKISWGAEYSRLLLVSRSRLVELNLKRRLQLEVIEAKSWSSIRDFNRVNDQVAVLTTSKEIIMILLRNDNIERTISWKHSLEAEDTSIKSTVRTFTGEEWFCRHEKLFFVFLYSGLGPEVLVHVFSQTGLLFQSLGTSLLHIRDIKNSMSCVFVPQIPLSFEDDKSRKPKLNCLVREAGGSVIWQVTVSAAEGESQSLEFQKGVESLSDRIDFVFTPTSRVSKEFTALKLSLPLVEYHSIASTEETIFQQYGYDLSDGMNHYLMKWAREMEDPEQVQSLECCSLASLAEQISCVSNMEEFGSLLEQFKGHYREQHVTFTALETLTTLITEDDDVADLGVFYSNLLQCWTFGFPDDGLITSEVLKSVILKNTGISSVSLLPVLAANAYSELNDVHREVVDSWDDPVDEIENKASLSEASNRDITEPELNFPSVKPSQQSPPKPKRHRKRISSQASQQSWPQPLNMLMSQTSTSNKHATHPADVSSVLPQTMTPAFSLTSASQPVPTLSDSQGRNSQKLKKKKKRLQGFG